MTQIVLIVDETEAAALKTLNESGPGDRELVPVTLTDGRKVLNGDLLEDCAAGHTWEHYGEFLNGLAIEEVNGALFPMATE